MSLGVGSLRAMAHPLRLRMLSLLTGTEMSAAELARELDITQSNASYHLRTLRDAGLVAETGTANVRGGIAKRYRYLVERRPPRSPGAATGQRRLRYEALAAELVRRAGEYRDGPRDLTDAELWVAPQVWADAVAGVRKVSDDLHAAAQPPGTPGTVRVSATVALFRMRKPRRGAAG